ncbi:secreted RxLR effector protein 161-like [Silene latifolia]|uniref:secreted RxLR effector protein 161-like n=1 Tax=Silene latifolia TaxID=37657 RepID=UPI003D78A75B
MKYRRLIGRLMYLTITRPDLVYAVHILSQFVHAPRKEHLDAVLRTIRYIKGSPGKGIVIERNNDLLLRGYSDSDYARFPLTRRSLTGYFVTLGHSPISWKARKQTTVAKLSAEAEYRALGAVTSEVIRLKCFLKSLGLNHRTPIEVFCDNTAALNIAKNPSKDQVADVFTKALGGEAFHFLRSKLGISLPSAPT